MKHKMLWSFSYVTMMMMIIMCDYMKAKRSSAEALKHCWYKGMYLASTDLLNK